jgi:nucleoid DNA-binding protein
MILVEEILSELLLQHSCVIIPQFGGFVAKQSSAKIDLERNIVIPPSKELLFNKHLISNDGLLINELASKSNCSFQDSENRVFQFVEEINSGLKNAKHFQLSKIGTFLLDAEGNINFEQDRHFNLLLNAYGLTSIQFISKVQVEKTEDDKENEKDPKIIPIQPVKRNKWKYVAAAEPEQHGAAAVEPRKGFWARRFSKKKKADKKASAAAVKEAGAVDADADDAASVATSIAPSISVSPWLSRIWRSIALGAVK